MDKKLSRKAIIASARKDIKSLPRPVDVSWIQWVRVTTLLHCLAGHLPEPYPSERVLAEKLGWSQPAVHRAVSKARSLGLLQTDPRAIPGSRWDGRTYLLTCLSDTTKAAIVRPRPESLSTQSLDSLSSPKVGTSSSKKYEVVPPPAGESLLSAAAPPRQEQPTPLNESFWECFQRASMARWEPDPEPLPFGADPEEPLVPLKIPQADPAPALVRLFDQVWKQAVRNDKRLRTIKPSHPKVAANYLRGIMLKQVDVDVVEAYIRQFPQRVLSGAVEINEGKNAFQAFIGTWGDEQVADPAETQRLQKIRTEQLQRRDEHVRQQQRLLDSGD